MSLLDYIRGNRKGTAAHKIEKESMKDPFLYEAMEGFDSVDDDHMVRIAALQKKIGSKKTEYQQQRSMWTSVAAVAVVVLAMIGGSHFLLGGADNGLQAHTFTQPPIDIYIPEAIYTENIAVIATKNTELTKDISVQFNHFKDEVRMDVEYTKMEKELLAMVSSNASDASVAYALEEDIEPIQILVPTGVNSPASKRTNLKPEPLIGFKKYEEYLKREVKNPTDWICKDVKGKVAIEFSVDQYGTPHDFDIYYSLCETNNAEAIRLIKDGPKWTPTNMRVMVKVEFK